ncbi:hypothetical protein BJY04DRAFT_222182 [Aspergillus karnatakaensis]|uniref:uncharacterized protein n=1 Tax=Aspergillus karnatakaensis TaxID=1810916 RepID=UPI003CCCDF4B
MHWPLLLALAALFQPGVARVGGYTEGAAERPTNVTGLNYDYYSSIGSYYNGTVTITVHPVYDPPNSYENAAAAYICDEFENKTFEVEMNAMTGIKMQPPRSAPHVNPFILDLRAWPKPFDLRVPRSDNYTTDEAFRFYSETGWDTGPRWLFNMSTPGTTNPAYGFSGRASTNGSNWEHEFVFNVTDVCDSSSTDMLYNANFLLPDDIEGSRDLVYDWVTDDLMTLPSVSGEFNEEAAVVRFAGTFTAYITRGSSRISGRAELTFRGTIDAERSDGLLLGGRLPEWNATLGFGERDGVAGLGQGASNRVKWSGGLLGLAGVVCVLVLM